MQMLAKHYAKHYAAQQQELSDDTVTNYPTNNKRSVPTAAAIATLPLKMAPSCLQ
jgi:hypothetical protein